MLWFGMFILSVGLTYGAFEGWVRAESLERGEIIQKIFESKMDGLEESFCARMPILPLSNEFKTILSQFNSKGAPSAEWIKYQWSSQSKFGENIANHIDSSSRYFREVRGNSNSRSSAFHGLERPSHFAGGDSKNYAFPSESAAKFFSMLFEQVEVSAKNWNPVTLSRWDLFHGHLIYEPRMADLLIVFHAKEYPRGNPALCENCLLKKLFDKVGEFPPSTVQMDPPTLSYLRRNFIWSLKRGRICGVNTSKRPFVGLAQEDGDSSTLDEGKASSLGEAGEILNINYFPREGSPLFVEFPRGLGSLSTLFSDLK